MSIVFHCGVIGFHGSKMSVVYYFLIVAEFWFITHVSSALLIRDEEAENMFWCSHGKCCLEYDADLWSEKGYTHTNECTTDKDCIDHSELNGCGEPDEHLHLFDWTTRFHCIGMGNQGKKYCTIGCILYAPGPCYTSPTAPTNSTHGVLEYCYHYYNDVSAKVEPYCPCFRGHCSRYGDCDPNPILEAYPPSPAPSP